MSRGRATNDHSPRNEDRKQGQLFQVAGSRSRGDIPVALRRMVMSEFKWRHFQVEIILWAVRWFCRYGKSYRDLEQMMGSAA
jgi:hypothetical protein